MKFVIKGTDDKARGLLGTNLEAQNKAFEASLKSMFKAPAPVKPAASPAKPAQPAQAAKPMGGNRGTLLGTNRDRRFR